MVNCIKLILMFISKTCSQFRYLVVSPTGSSPFKNLVSLWPWSFGERGDRGLWVPGRHVTSQWSRFETGGAFFFFVPNLWKYRTSATISSYWFLVPLHKELFPSCHFSMVFPSSACHQHRGFQRRLRRLALHLLDRTGWFHRGPRRVKNALPLGNSNFLIGKKLVVFFVCQTCGTQNA